MSDNSTKRMIAMYEEDASAPLFLSGFFQSPPRNFHNSELIEIDVIREDEEVAIVVQDLTAGARANESNRYTNKGFTPPIFDEEGTIHAYDMIKRQPGVDPFQDPSFGATALAQSFRIFRRLERKIRRAIELMASQVFASGTLTLTDGAGTQLYGVDFSPKATHFITTAAEWVLTGATGDPIADLAALADVIRKDGKKRPDILVFGSSAMQRFLANDKVKAVLDNRRIELGLVAPETRGEGATFNGEVWIGNYKFQLWAYDGFYKDPVSGNPTEFVNPEHVLMLSSGGRLDLTFGAIPMIGPQAANALPFLPARIPLASGGLDLTTSSWFTNDRKHLKVSAGTRPLTIPTAIDTFGRIDVVP